MSTAATTSSPFEEVADVTQGQREREPTASTSTSEPASLEGLAAHRDEEQHLNQEQGKEPTESSTSKETSTAESTFADKNENQTITEATIESTSPTSNKKSPKKKPCPAKPSLAPSGNSRQSWSNEEKTWWKNLYQSCTTQSQSASTATTTNKPIKTRKQFLDIIHAQTQNKSGELYEKIYSQGGIR